MVGQGAKAEDLELCFQKLVVFGGGREKMGGGAVMTGWKDLPMELLLRIVSLVDDRTAIIASGVCTGWRDAICLGLTHLCLSWCKDNMNNLVLSVAPKFTKLQTLTLRQNKPQLEDSAVETIANCCHDLKDLDLSKSFKLSDRSLYALAHGCPNLTKLNISGCSAFSDSALVYLTGFCRNLKYLNLCGCVRAATDRALQAIAYNCSQLQCLNLGWCEGVTDAGVTSLAYGCPDLRALDLCGCVLITGISYVEICYWAISDKMSQLNIENDHFDFLFEVSIHPDIEMGQKAKSIVYGVLVTHRFDIWPIPDEILNLANQDNNLNGADQKRKIIIIQMGFSYSRKFFQLIKSICSVPARI
uniref:F-box/LRR-repeat protein 15-like leucin rich repeat domain-containing protein n=1 Tax=Nelumbo nucifera TaxID=4432 RepID=A0A822Z8S7_NELNU|nr:TPA_asm: hypothetical protein HUJ06_014188 [Nelumbo nucifera]